jgi:O-methyltransferase
MTPISRQAEGGEADSSRSDGTAIERNGAFRMPVGAQIRRVRGLTGRALRAVNGAVLYSKYRAFTMAPVTSFWKNLLIADARRHVSGCVVECGVWRGGMSAAIAELLGKDREYFLFDSFEGLPSATAEDGDRAKAWQQDTKSPNYYDNCRAPIEYAQRAMRMAGVPRYHIVKGWFDQTVVGFVPPAPIAILRLDGDWYGSTLVVLRSLFKYLARDGIVIVDDYYAWDGCSRAVHDFLSRNQLIARVTQEYGICVIVPAR